MATRRRCLAPTSERVRVQASRPASRMAPALQSAAVMRSPLIITRILTLTWMTAIVACGPGGGESETDATSDEPGSTGSSTSEPTGSTTSEPTGSTGSTGSTGESSSTTSEPDPDFVRECQPNDFKCEDWGCNNQKSVKLGECYKRCTPDVIGEKDAECDEPERPFCSQIGVAGAGDFDCNDCTHVCVAEPINQCSQDAQSCAG